MAGAGDAAVEGEGALAEEEVVEGQGGAGGFEVGGSFGGGCGVVAYQAGEERVHGGVMMVYVVEIWHGEEMVER